MSPKRPDLILSADIPNIETCVLVRDGLDVEANGRNGVDFAGGARGELESVEDGFDKLLAVVRRSLRSIDSSHKTCASRSTCPYSACGLADGRTGLSGGIETKHQQAHFLAAEDLGQGARECGAHGECMCCVVL